MKPAEAITVIQKCFEDGDYFIRQHVFDRLLERNLSEIELFGIIEEPDEARSDGHDQLGRERWFISGTLYDGTKAELLIVLDHRPHATLFTVYWID
ncbi:MAG: hypothetical protein AAF743_09240 [Planctomycetota bacterium]